MHLLLHRRVRHWQLLFEHKPDIAPIFQNIPRGHNDIVNDFVSVGSIAMLILSCYVIFPLHFVPNIYSFGASFRMYTNNKDTWIDIN